MTERLRAIAGFVPPCDAFYDIGTDHGLLPAFLLREGRCNRAVPCDISRDSLGKAKRLFMKMGLSERASFHLGNGLEGLTPAPRDCVAICGVGAHTMLRILREGLPCPVVLSTHVDVEALREALPAKGYRIERERLVREDRRFYVIMHVVLGFDRPYAGADAYIGRNLLGDPLLEEYIDWREGVARRAGAGGDALWKRRLVWIEEARAWNKNC